MRIAFSLYGRVAGIIEREGGRTRLNYLPEHLSDPLATPLSLSMPVSPATYTARPVEAYLDGLLPDHQEVRARWARRAGVRPGNTLGLIAHVGMDVAGGAMFAREDEIADAIARPGALAPASEAEIADRLRRVRQDDAAWQADEDDEHWSLAGAQSKFTLARTPDGWAFPEGSAASTHIVKPGIGRIRAQALSEHVSMRALALVGLDVAATEHRTFEDQEALLIARFDRRVGRDGRAVRVHQEDVLQAFGMDPRRKYEADRGPGVRQIADLLRVAAGAASVERFARAVVANQIIGAPDAHGKNYGLLLVGPSVTLAPLYDVATGLIPDGTGRLRYAKGAMSVGGERRFGDVEREHWEKFARALEVPTGLVLDWVDELATSLPAAFRQAATETTAPDSDFLAGPVADNITAVAEQTRKGLSTTRRAHGRLATPFLRTLPGQDGRARPPRPSAPETSADVDRSPADDQDAPWGA
ncbi:type II toxin-antitoxin system HipA family toxin [Oerskovia turbata]